MGRGALAGTYLGQEVAARAHHPGLPDLLGEVEAGQQVGHAQRDRQTAVAERQRPEGRRLAGQLAGGGPWAAAAAAGATAQSTTPPKSAIISTPQLEKG